MFRTSWEKFIRILVDRDSFRRVRRITSAAEETSSTDTTISSLQIERMSTSYDNERVEVKLYAAKKRIYTIIDNMIPFLLTKTIYFLLIGNVRGLEVGEFFRERSRESDEEVDVFESSFLVNDALRDEHTAFAKNNEERLITGSFSLTFQSCSSAQVPIPRLRYSF